MFHLQCRQLTCGVGCLCRLVTEKTHSLRQFNFLKLLANTNVKSQTGPDLLASLSLPFVVSATIVAVVVVVVVVVCCLLLLLQLMLLIFPFPLASRVNLLR